MKRLGSRPEMCKSEVSNEVWKDGGAYVNRITLFGTAK